MFESAASTESGLTAPVASLYAATPLPDKPLITGGVGRQSLNLRELWAARELLYFLTWRDIKVRYKQTVMGAAWAVIQPLVTMLVFTLFFNQFVGVSSNGIPYPIFAYTGLLPWTFFANAVNNCSTSLVNNSNLITKVYFPRLLVPTAAVAAGLVDLAIASIILVGLALYYGLAVTWSGLLMLPVYVALTTLFALGVGVWLSALTVKYRDVRHALPFVLQLWMFASPIIYPSSVVKAQWRWVLLINPMAGIIENFRASLTGQSVNWQSLGLATALTILMLLVAVYAFRRFEKTFADLV